MGARRLTAAVAVVLLAPFVAATGSLASAAPPGDDTPTLLTPKGEIADEFHELDESADFTKLEDAYYETRLLSGDQKLSLVKAAQLRRNALRSSDRIPRVSKRTRPGTVGGAWTSVGPDPSVQVGRTSNTLQAVSGRIGALAVRRDGTILAGGAQGGVWMYDAATQRWHPTTNDADTQSVGALAVAPSNDKVVYLGSGEGALSGDSYYGDGVYRSDNGGQSWSHVSGTFFQGMSTSDIVVDPANSRHLYISTIRGRGGARRTTPPSSRSFGIWESTNGGVSWTLRKGVTSEFHGATDLVMDPLAPKTLWASFWGDAIYRTTDGGATWQRANGNLPEGQFDAAGTRFSLGIAHVAGHAPVVYAGFDYVDTAGAYHPATLWRNDTGGFDWKHLPTGGPASDPDSILDYCTTQCFYDNVVMPDPTNPDTVYVEGSYGYDQSPQSGGVYRSTDGGQTWKSLGYDLHPDFHALAFQPGDSKHVVVGNDGGVWQSHDRGGRLAAGEPLSSVDWENLNGTVSPAGAFVHSTGLRIAQFTSVATVPKVAGQYWGGTQDNGTQRKSTAPGDPGLRWFDQPSGDGGQVIVDQTTPNTLNPGVSAFVFGTYFGISPYRFDQDGITAFFGNEPIDGGIDLTDRAEFYVPWVQNRGNTDQMFLGTYRLYRTNNAEAASAGDVHWDPISPDLTTGCAGTAPNGARGCILSAVGLADGGDAVYTGSDDGKVFVSPDAVTADHPTWRDVTRAPLPNRPVTQIAVDKSNWRIAYLSYAGFGAATPGNAGHVFATSDGGRHWKDVSRGLPDVPANSVVLDPAFPDTLYVGTDIGPYVSTDSGRHWLRLGTAMPKVASWQLDFDASHRLLANGTHGRGAYTLTDDKRQSAPALVVSKKDSGVPVGPGTEIHYTITVRNLGNQDATGVTVEDPLPAHTRFASASNGGRTHGNTVRWTGLTVPAGASTSVDLVVRIDPRLSSSVTSIVDDGLRVRAAGGFGTTGSPHTTPIAPAHAVTVDPAEQTGAARAGDSASYVVHVTNGGFTDDSYTLTTPGPWSAATYDASCTTPLSGPLAVASGATRDVCVKVAVPATGVADGDKATTTLTATSTADPTVSASATMTTIAVTADTLLVDGDGGSPDVEGSYRSALTDAGAAFSYWDLAADPELPASVLTSHTNVVWFTGNSYPSPVTPYEGELKTFLDGGGRLLMSGQDILDQAGGTTAFVHDYLHIDWDGSEVQNDKATDSVASVSGNPVTDGIGTVPLDHSVLGANFEDQVTPIAPASPAFTDTLTTPGQPDALTVADGPYKVMFLAFPLEAYGSSAQKASLMSKTLAWFGS